MVILTENSHQILSHLIFFPNLSSIAAKQRVYLSNRLIWRFMATRPVGSWSIGKPNLLGSKDLSLSLVLYFSAFSFQHEAVGRGQHMLVYKESLCFGLNLACLVHSSFVLFYLTDHLLFSLLAYVSRIKGLRDDQVQFY